MNATYYTIKHSLSTENGVLILTALNAVLNPICHLLALLGAHHILHVSRIRVKAPVPEHLFL